MDGITIGDGAVIGAGAIVTNNVMPYEVVVGVLAKHIKYRFEEEKIKNLKQLKWWDWDIEKINSSISWLRNESKSRGY